MEHKKQQWTCHLSFQPFFHSILLLKSWMDSNLCVNLTLSHMCLSPQFNLPLYVFQMAPAQGVVHMCSFLCFMKQWGNGQHVVTLSHLSTLPPQDSNGRTTVGLLTYASLHIPCRDNYSVQDILCKFPISRQHSMAAAIYGRLFGPCTPLI